jgi:hypothetical protein
MNRNWVAFTALVLFFVRPLVSAGQEPCTPGELRTDSTPTCISIEWDVTGD